MVSAVYKSSAISFIYLILVYIFAYKRTSLSIFLITFVVGVIIIVQYSFALANFSTDNNPMPWSHPLPNPYPCIPCKEGYETLVHRCNPKGCDDQTYYSLPLYMWISPFNDFGNAQWTTFWGFTIIHEKLASLTMDYIAFLILFTYFYMYSSFLYNS